MKITLANKRVAAKPRTEQEKAAYFNGLEFKTGNFKVEDWEKIVSNGYTITYTFNDGQFNRTNCYMKDNYKGTDFICVDIDSCDIEPKEFIKNLKYKPTIYHTTFSNKTDYKDGKYCFHLIYCFIDFISGEKDFSTVFGKLTEDYSQLVDNAAKDCHRCIFTSNSNLPNFEMAVDGNNLYNSTDFLTTSTTSFDDLDNFFNVGVDVKVKKEPKQTTSFQIDDTLFKDFWSLDRKTFISKYSPFYPFLEATEFKYNEMGFADLRGVEYYEIYNRYKYLPELGKGQVVKTEIGKRGNQLYIDGLTFLKIIPNCTKEYLLVSLVIDVFKYFDNSDKEMSNIRIFEAAKAIWADKDKNFIKPIKKNFKVSTAYWRIKYGKDNSFEAISAVKKLMKDSDIADWIDEDLSLEENLKELKKHNVIVKKDRLLEFLNRYKFNILSEKEIRNKKVIEIYENNKDKSYRELEKICRDNSIIITDKTIKSIISNYTN